MGGKSQQQQTTNEPWSGQQPYLRDVFSNAQDLYNQGSRIVPFNSEQIAGQEEQLNAARTNLPSLVNSGQDAYRFALNAPDVRQNPYLPQLVQSATAPIRQDFVDNLIPSVNDASIQNGTFGGSGNAITKGIALGRLADAETNIAAKIYSDAYGQGLDAQGRAMALSPQMLAASLFPGEVLQNVGGQRQLAEQALADEPKDRLEEYLRFISGNFGGTSITTAPGASKLGGALGGGALGYTLLGSSMGGPWGAGLGALAGLALS